MKKLVNPYCTVLNEYILLTIQSHCLTAVYVPARQQNRVHDIRWDQTATKRGAVVDVSQSGKAGRAGGVIESVAGLNVAFAKRATSRDAPPQRSTAEHRSGLPLSKRGLQFVHVHPLPAPHPPSRHSHSQTYWLGRASNGTTDPPLAGRLDRVDCGVGSGVGTVRLNVGRRSVRQRR